MATIDDVYNLLVTVDGKIDAIKTVVYSIKVDTTNILTYPLGLTTAENSHLLGLDTASVTLEPVEKAHLLDLDTNNVKLETTEYLQLMSLKNTSSSTSSKATLSSDLIAKLDYIYSIAIKLSKD